MPGPPILQCSKHIINQMEEEVMAKKKEKVIDKAPLPESEYDNEIEEQGAKMWAMCDGSRRVPYKAPACLTAVQLLAIWGEICLR